MPLLNQSSVGASTVTSSILDSQDTITFTTDTNSIELFVDQLPNLVFYAVQTAGTTPCTFIAQAALRSTTGGGSEPQLDYLDLSGETLMPANDVPILLNFRFPANYIRFSFKATAATHTVKFVLAGFSP
jgi:hypothetical protein